MKRLKLFFSLLFVTIITQAQVGKVMESLEMKSEILGYSVKYSIYLPPDYESSVRSYPVLYLLHGFSDDETAWIQFGEANETADKLIDSGEISPMIIVMPDGKVTWYCNDYKNENPWEDMFIKEFIPYIESTYRIRQKKEFRAISGLSMGGYGSLHLSMRNSDLFSSCVAFSSGTFTDEEIVTREDQNYKDFYGNLYGDNLKGKDRLSKHWKAYSPIHLLQSVSLEKLKSVRYYIDCGDDDFLSAGNAELHLLMRKLDIPHEYRVRQGGHSWFYWREGLGDGLKFISEKFHR